MLYETIFLLFSVYASCNIIIHSGIPTEQIIESSPLVFGGNSLFFTTIHNTTVRRIYDAIPGDAVFLTHGEISSSNLLKAMDIGASVIIISYNSRFVSPGCAMYFVYDRSLKRLSIPIVEVNDDDLEGIVPNGTITATITSTHNGCHSFFSGAGFAIMQAILALVCFAALVLCVVRAYQYYKLGDLFEISLPVVAIAIETVGNTLKFIYILNFFGSRQLYAYQFDEFMLSISFPLSTITNVLITMFWHETLVAKGVQIHVFLKTKRFRICFIALSAFLIITDIVAAILRAATTETPTAILYIPFILNFFTNFTVLIYSVVILTRVYKRAGGFESKKSKLLTKILRRLTLNSILIVILLFSVIVMAIPAKQNIATRKTVYSLGFFYCSQMALSILQVYSFQPVGPLKTSTGSKNSKTSSSTSKNDIHIDKQSVAQIKTVSKPKYEV